MDSKEIIEFIRTLYPGQERIPLSVPVFGGNEKKYLAECIDSTFVSSVGPFVDRFEKEIAEFTGAKRAVVTVNGTAALHMALLLCGVQPGDEVLTQALTFVATCNAISYSGAQPVFIDIDENTLSLSSTALRHWLESNAMLKNGQCINRRTGATISAVVPMHTFGHPARLDELITICGEWGLPLIEDAAEGIGSLYKDKHVGTMGTIGALSFNGNKTITTGGGGMLLFNDEELGGVAKHLTTQAKVPHPWRFHHDAIGYNYRMPNINAALGCAQLEQAPQFIAKKRSIAQKYKEFFQDKPDVKFVVEPNGCQSNYWLNAIILENGQAAQKLLEDTNKARVMTRPAWDIMNTLPMFEHCQTDGLKITSDLAPRIVNLPSSSL